jgi:hypothetical protein
MSWMLRIGASKCRFLWLETITYTKKSRKRARKRDEIKKERETFRAKFYLVDFSLNAEKLRAPNHGPLKLIS